MRAKLSPLWAACISVPFVLAIACCFAEGPQEPKTSRKKNSSNANTLCYVCHLGLQNEEITVVHLKGGITCDKCHGSSAHHMHDETLMTKPDILFGRSEVEAMCRTCHKTHKNAEAVEAFHKEWLGRSRPNGRTVAADSVCTDCHGTHNIPRHTPGASEKGRESSTEWVKLFNGENLSNWQMSGGVSWTVRQASIVATAGPKGKGGDLWSKDEYQDYLLSVTFRAKWPNRAGIWLRALQRGGGPRVEIFESAESAAFTGSLFLPGRGLVLVNLRDNLVARDSWNTISVKVAGDRLQVWLNGEEVGAVRIGGPAKGKIGLHLSDRKTNKNQEFVVREVLVKRLAEEAAE